MLVDVSYIVNPINPIVNIVCGIIGAVLLAIFIASPHDCSLNKNHKYEFRTAIIGIVCLCFISVSITAFAIDCLYVRPERERAIKEYAEALYGLKAIKAEEKYHIQLYDNDKYVATAIINPTGEDGIYQIWRPEKEKEK